MPRRQYTTANLAAEVRAQLDESNTDTVSDAGDIYPALNRALDYAGDILARKYPDPFLRHVEIPVVGDQQEYDIPEDCFEDRILKVELAQPNNKYELRRVSFYDISNSEGTTTASPSVYAIIGRKMRLAPTPSSSSFPLRIWYFRQPEELVAPQARLTAINITGNYILADGEMSDLDTESDTLESYINIVDGQTGIIKWTGQIQLLTDQRITFRTTPTRTLVLNRPVSSTLPTSIEEDDWICSIRGTCVPEFSQPISNFLIQYAVSEITRKLGGDAPTEAAVLERFEKQITTTWSGREGTVRIKPRSNALGTSRGRRSRWPITSK